MALSFLKYIIIVSFAMKWQNTEGTKYQPSVIWDRFNKLLTCKCNWMNIPRLWQYDRIELLCPRQNLISTARYEHVGYNLLFYSIYVREWNLKNHTLEELQESLNNDSFCDPQHKETSRYYSCNDPQIEPHTVRFNRREHGDVLVFFSNAVRGDIHELSSKDKRCTMVFIVNVTKFESISYDMSYGKCFSPDSYCQNITKDCVCGHQEVTPTKPSKTVEQKSSTSPEEWSTEASVAPPEKGALTSDRDGFPLALFFGGIAIGIVVAVIVNIVFYFCYCREKQGKADCREVKHGTRTLEKNRGYPNEAFVPVTPTSVTPEDSDVNFYENVLQNSHPANGRPGRLPPVETREILGRERASEVKQEKVDERKTSGR